MRDTNLLKILIRRILVFATLLGCVLTSPTSVAARPTATATDGGMSWYCAHKAGHVQPRADACFDFMRSCDGYYIDYRHSDPDDADKVVYLTFDVGYENGNVTKVLDALRDADVPAAFFILGHIAEKSTALLHRMADEGHLVCNHTFTHKVLIGSPAEALADELGRLERACAAEGVSVAKYFRPPEGKFDRAMLESARDLGYKTVFWSFAYADWDNDRQPNVEWAKKKILDNMHNGAVLLLHPTSATNAAVLGVVIDTLKSQGYRFGTLDELTDSTEGKAATLPRYPSPFRAEENVTKDIDTEEETRAETEAETEEKRRDELIYHGRPNDRMEIALSFDDGPHPRYTPMILEILREYGIKATFFMVGENVRYYTAAAEAVVAAGHEIENHTFTHRKIRSMNESEFLREIKGCEDAILSVSEQRPQFIRPPEGTLTEAMRHVIEDLDYRIVLWDVDTRDWAHTPPDTIAQNILDTVRAGDIILMHDFIGHDSPTPEALRIVIPALLDRGYHFVTVGELVDGAE